MHSFLGKASRPAAICGGLLFVHALILAWAAAANSATFDEPAHLAAGVDYWKQGDFTLYSLSPPLLRLWAAAPVVLAGAQSPESESFHFYEIAARHMLYTDHFIYANESRLAFFIILARWVMIPISVFAGWMIYRWAAQLYGGVSGAAACALWCFTPSVLANGSLMTTDMGTTAAILAAAWLWWRFCLSPGFFRWIWLCVALAIAHLCKFTAVLLWPMMIFMAVPFLIQQRSLWRRLLVGWIACGLATVFLLNAVYAFRGTGRALGDYQFNSKFMEHIQKILPAKLPVPMPKLLVEGFDAQKRDEDPGYQGFLLGENYVGVRWDYYPVALLCKLPISLMILMLIAAGSVLIPRPQGDGKDVASQWSVLLAALAYLLGVFAAGNLNIGTRYLLPMLPFVVIFVSRLWAYGQVRWLWKVTRNGLLAALVVETMVVCPHFISFMNYGALQYAADLANGAPSGGWRLINDSDFDWGQDLNDLRRWMKKNQMNSIALAYFGYVDPVVYGIHYTPLSKPGPDEKYAAISSFYLDGLYNRIVESPYHRIWGDLPGYKILRDREPVAVVGNTIYIYHLSDVRAAALQAGVMTP